MIGHLDFIVDKVLRISPTSLVDIGCGDGRLTRELSLHVGNYPNYMV